MKFHYNAIGNRILEIRGKMGALERVRKENLQRGNFEKARKLEKERNELEREYKFISKRIKLIIKKKKVPQNKYRACFDNGNKFHCGDVCYHSILGKCYLYDIREEMAVKVDTTIVRQCGVCDQMVFQSQDIVKVGNRLYHKECARKIYSGYREKFIKKEKKDGRTE